MQKHLANVLVSILGVATVILFGMNVAYRTNVIPELEREFHSERNEALRREVEQSAVITRLENEINIALEKQRGAEKRLSEKIAEEERIALEKARAEQVARLAAQRAAAQAAAQAAAEAKEKSSKKSKAS